MKSTFLILFIFLNIFMGCSATNTHLIKHDQTIYDMLSMKLMEQEGKMVFINGEIISGDNFNIGLDSTSWIEKQISNSKQVVTDGSSKKVPAGEPLTKTIATSEIDYFSLINRNKGAQAGVGTGSWVGAAAGSLWGLTLVGTGRSGNMSPAILIFTIPFGGLVGAMIGLPIGLIVGGTDKYILTKISEDSAATSIESKELIRKK